MIAKKNFSWFNNDMVQVSNNNSDSKGMYVAKSALGITAGYLGYGQAFKYSTKIYPKILNKYLEQNSANYNDEILLASKKFLENSDLKDKGVKIVHLSDEKSKTIVDNYITFLDKKYANLKPEKLRQYLYNKRLNNIKRRQEAVKNGLNAYYTHSAKNKEVIVNTKKLAEAIPHELGHAQNFNSNNFLRKLLVSSRGQSARLTKIVFLAGLLMPKREKGEKSNDVFVEGMHVMKEHTGLFIFVSMLPVLIEEGLASINAAKMMKGNISEKALKHLNKTNFMAWGSYLTGSILMSLCASGAIFLKDKITGSKPPKKEAVRTI